MHTFLRTRTHTHTHTYIHTHTYADIHIYTYTDIHKNGYTDANYSTHIFIIAFFVVGLHPTANHSWRHSQISALKRKKIHILFLSFFFFFSCHQEIITDGDIHKFWL